jgi:hypothetical protein
MKDSWRHYLRRLATATLVSGSVALSSAMCYAVQVLYSDNASNAAYADGWQEGDDGDGPGGFGPWNFDGVAYNGSEYNTQTILQMDDGLKHGTQTSSPWNDIGQSWVLQNPRGRNVGTTNGAVGTDISQPGRTFPALQVGQTLSVLVDNPIQRFFFRGYAIKLNYGPDASSCYQGDNCSTPGYDPGSVPVAFGLGTFEYFDYGIWDGTTLYDEDTDSGVWIDFTLTGPTTYTFTMTPLDTSVAPYSEDGTLPSQVTEIDWLELEFYNTDSDFYPAMIASPQATDFYVREMKITIPDATGQPGDFNEDGKVDAADYVVWRKLGNNVLPNDNGVATSAERFNLWRANFGEMAGGGGGTGSGAIPEPGSLVLMITAGGLMSAIRPRRR